MINKKQFSDAARKILRHSKGLKDPKLMHPEREWTIGLTVALIICILVASGSALTYFNNKHLTAEEPHAAEESVVYRDSMVKEALKRFEERNSEREALLGALVPAPVMTDPVATSTGSSIDVVNGDEASTTIRTEE